MVGPSVYIEGAYYTVNPVAINNSINVYGENKRVLTQIFSPQFGTNNCHLRSEPSSPPPPPPRINNK